MVAPTATERATVLRRDDFMCVACGGRFSLEMHHRRRVGAGGSDERVGLDELLTACALCNAGFEASGQTEALVYGWKVRKWADPLRVPVFNMPRCLWGLLRADGSLGIVDVYTAIALMGDVYGDDWSRWRRWLGSEAIGLGGR